MTGAIAGSTAALFNSFTDKLSVVTLTINNRCNLNCPHCYLNYKGDDSLVNDLVLDMILKSKYNHISIVGKEPLVDSESAATVKKIACGCIDSSSTVSIVTNGQGLHLLSPEEYSFFKWLDISMDGGVETYSKYRRANFVEIIRNIFRISEKSAIPINSINTISRLNIKAIDDIANLSSVFAWNKILFSPYSPEYLEYDKTNSLAISLPEFILCLKESHEFMNNQRAFAFVGSRSFAWEGVGPDEIIFQVNNSGLLDKFIIIPNDPLELGYMRITYDGYFMTPYQSLLASDYSKFSIPLNLYPNLNQAYNHLRALNN